MKKAMKKMIAVMMAAAMAAACGCGTSNYTADNTEYFIGGTGPLTGDAASYGTSVQKGIQIAINEINANGGLDGVKFKFEMKDDKAAAADAGTGYDTLYEAGMQISFGSVTSGSCKAFAAKAAQDNVFFMTPSASEQAVIESGDNAFRVCFGDPDQGTLAAQELAGKYANIGVLYESSSSYSLGIYQAFEAEMKKLGKSFSIQTFDSENNKDFSTQMEALKDCDAIFMPFYYTEAALAIKTAAAKGCAAVMFGSDGFDGLDGQINPEDNISNTIMYITPFDAASTDPAVSAFVAAYQAANNGETPDQFAADGYDAVMAIYQAMKAAGVKDVTISASDLSELVKKEMLKLTYTGATGTMTWDTSGACTKVPQIVTLKK